MAFSTGIDQEEEQGKDLEESLSGNAVSEATKRIIESSPEWQEHRKKHPDAKLTVGQLDDKPKTLGQGPALSYDMRGGQKHDIGLSYHSNDVLGGGCNCGAEFKAKGGSVYEIASTPSMLNDDKKGVQGYKTDSSNTFSEGPTLLYSNKTANSPNRSTNPSNNYVR